VNGALLDPFRHNAWATAELLAICGALEGEQLEATAPGTYGSVVRTLHHLISSEDYYLSLLTGRQRRWRSSDETPTLDELGRRAGDLAAAWEDFLSRPFDTERLVTDEDEDGVSEIRAGMVIAQILNHGTDHRTQILTILSTLGVEHPELDGWDYGYATGRVVTKPPS